MPIPIKQTQMVNASGDASGTSVVDSPDSYHVHRFFISISAAATVKVQGSPDGSTWIDLLDSDITASDLAVVDRPFAHLRVTWSGNNDTVSVWLDQLYSKQDGWV